MQMANIQAWYRVSVLAISFDIFGIFRKIPVAWDAHAGHIDATRVDGLEATLLQNTTILAEASAGFLIGLAWLIIPQRAGE
jgi:hypothetical protein